MQYVTLLMNNQPISLVTNHKHIRFTLDEYIKWQEHYKNNQIDSNYFETWSTQTYILSAALLCFAHPSKTEHASCYVNTFNYLQYV
jgi:hypothetical protein